MVLRRTQALKQLKWVLLAVTIGFTLVLASGRITHLHPVDEISKSNSYERADAPLRGRSQSIESELIAITPRGFEPAEITRAEGQFILMVDNRSGTELNFRLLRDNGQPLHAVRSTREEPDWNEVLDLRPGRYVLTELNHPEWTCSIRITAR
jgi:hypothetical protein